MGTGKGIHPGRVTWVHAPEATDWDGPGSGEYWWQTNHTDRSVVESMFSQGIRSLTGQGTTGAAWNALFRNFNETHGRGYTGYKAGEKIAVKLNLVTCIQMDSSTYTKSPDHMDRIDPAPQMVHALLNHLVNTVGVAQTNITLSDPTSFVPNYYLNMLSPDFPDVHWVDNHGGLGRERATFSSTQLHWSTPDAEGKVPDYLPQCFADADYLINFAVLKGHSSGITVCGKNNYGSLIRTPTGWLRGVHSDYYNMHYSLPNPTWDPGMGHYRSIVDLTGHPDLGGKTLLYLIDGLYAGYYWNAEPKKWNSLPFNGDWPSSLFMSQDPVAIDSVAYDFLLMEWPDVVTTGGSKTGTLEGGAQDFLHEAALAYEPASETFYDSDGDGTRMTSLGVHEHWNDPTNKLYSRNLGMEEGIELIAHTATSQVDAEPHPGLHIRSMASTNASHRFGLSHLTPDLEYTVQRRSSLLSNEWSTVSIFTAASHEAFWSCTSSNHWHTTFYRLKSN